MTLLLLVVLRAVSTAPIPPYAARLLVDAAFVRGAPEERALAVGLLRLGDEVTVLGCAPACGATGAWALLDGGAIRTALLRPTRADEPPPVRTFDYGRVRSSGARVRAVPDDGSRILERRPAGQDLAFIPDPVLRAAGWLRRVYGGFVRADEIRPSTASAFAGQVDPSLPLGFVVEEGSGHHRGDRAAVLSIEKGRVVLPDGELLRDHVRVARAHPRPAGIPNGARWVHVSLREQTLVAYDADTPAYATLVSTGRDPHATPIGLYRVWYKEIHGPMHADPPEPYFVDEVPFVQYFRDGMALHGTFWHDRFGRRASHGCVNLSMTDARWLFDWAPPRLPAGWHAIEPAPAHLPTLWVLITR